jgi:class 3 adenylate cyclase/tetratricopeptide (TPR) repeat protein
VITCTQCGRENPEAARFCNSCGAPLDGGSERAREVRKTVSIVFCDLVGSTALGERTDPEVLRELMSGYHATLRSILERHGGTVEKFVGDAAMAVFGIPNVHEDDAVRAVRAAVEMRHGVGELGLSVRIGVGTGEVAAGVGETLVTGDAVNVAARLEQAAEPGEILISAQTEGLVGSLVRAEAVAPLELKGKAQAVPAFRLLEVLPDVAAFTAPISVPFVGRVDELAALRDAYAHAVEERVPQLCTIVGPPGIGKSRIVREFLAGAREHARILVGRCLPYGEGITYWPLGEIVRQVGGDQPHDVIAQIVGGNEAALVADRLVGAISLGPAGGSPEEISWAARKLFEAIAQDRPAIVVVDDIHWAEPTLLDLLEYVATFATGAPLLVLCTARPDLFEARPTWSNPRRNAVLVSLEPLGAQESEALIDSLQEVDASMRSRIVEAAEGNPLFVEQFLAMRADGLDGELGIPPSIHALLSARLDRLEPVERAVIERAAVEGRLFHRGAVTELLSPGARVTVGSHLITLVRKEFVRPDAAIFLGDDGFRFGHVLIRDAAYESIPKRLRAELHERYASWLETKLGEHTEQYDEILGFHLEQAHRYRVDLGAPDRVLAGRASARLGAAGGRALDRGDMDGAANLFERATALLEPDDVTRIELEVDLGDALLESGRLADAEMLLEGVVGRAGRAGDRRLEARAQVGLGFVRIQTQTGETHDAIRREFEPLVSLFEAAGDHRGAADALRLLGRLATWGEDYGAGSDFHERALLHARAAGDGRRQAASIRHIVSAGLWGPEPVDLALVRCRAILDDTTNPQVQANCLIRIGGLEGLAGRFDAARETIAAARALMDDLGLRHLRAHSSDVAVYVEMLASDYQAAEREASAAYAVLTEMGDRTFQSSEAHFLAMAMEAQGRLDDAERWLTISGAPGESHTIAVEAQIEARRGNLEDAERLARSALELGEDRHVPQFADPRFTLAQILARMGRNEEARQETEQCMRLYEAKGIVPLMERARALLATLPVEG